MPSPEKIREMGGSASERPGRPMILAKIRDQGLADPEVIKILNEYILDMEEKFKKQNPETADIELSLHIADLYFEAKDTDLALETLKTAEQQATESGDNEMIERVKSVKELITESLR